MNLTEPEKIEAFKETYDALYIEDLSDEKKEEIREKVNPVLKQLIDHLQFPKTYNVDIIEGPISFYKLKLNRKSFYLFGEKHKDTRGHCLPMDSISFSEYIKRLSENSPSFFDLYIELSMFRFSKPKTEGDLSVLNLALKTIWSDILVICYNNYSCSEFGFSKQLFDFLTKLKEKGHLKHLHFR